MDFIVVWAHESGQVFYLEEIKFTGDGCAMRWNKEKAIRFYASEEQVINEILKMYFDGKYFFEEV